jgi:hypothetical protein
MTENLSRWIFHNKDGPKFRQGRNYNQGQHVLTELISQTGELLS